MVTKFTFNAEIDNATDFMTGIAPYLEARKTGDLSGIDIETFMSMPDEVQLNGEIYKACVTSVKNATSFAFRNARGNGKQKANKEDFEQDLWTCIFREAHTFNNPKDKEHKEIYSIDTIVNKWAANVSKLFWGAMNGQKEQEVKMQFHIKKVIDALIASDHISAGKITAQMLYDNQDLARDEMVLTLKQVEDMYLAMNRERVEFDDIRDAVADSEAGKWSGIEYQEAVSAFQKALGGCQDSELYIYSGSLYMREGMIGIREISSDLRLIDMIKRQPKSRSLLRRRDQPLKDAEGYISEGLSDTQYVKLSYIKETIRRMDAYMKVVFEKLEFSDEEMKMCINYLMNKEWD